MDTIALVDAMDVANVKDSAASTPSCSPKNLTPAERVVLDDEQEANKCKHFTIRGYVAEVREKDTKLCWPFIMLHGHTAYEDANLLPPLSTAKFRRWNCQNCRARISSAESGAPIQTVVNVVNDEVKNENMLLGDAPSVFHPNGKTFPSCFPKKSEERMLGAWSISADSSLIIDKLEGYSSHKKENGSEFVDMTEEGCRKIFNDSHYGCKKKPRQSSESTHITVENEVYEMGDGKRKATKSMSTSETDPPGSRRFKDDHDRYKEKQSQSNESTYIATDFEACQRGDGKRYSAKHASTSEIAPSVKNESHIASPKKKETKLPGSIFGTEKCKMMSDKLKETKSNQGFVGAEMSTAILFKSLITEACGHNDDQDLNEASVIKESDIVTKGYGMTLGLDFDTSKNDVITDIAANMFDEDSIDLDKGIQRVSEKHIGLKDKMVQMQNITSHLYTSNGKMNHKKARKVRKLDDILRSEDLHVPKKSSVLNGDIETSKRASDRMPDALEERAENPVKVYLVNQNSEENLNKRKQINETSQYEDEEHSLMHWLKRLPKEPVTHNRDEESNHMDIAVGLSKVADKSIWKEIQSKQEYGKLRRHAENTVVSRKKYMMPQEKARQPRLADQQNNTAGEGCKPEYMLTKQLNYKGFDSLPTKVIIPKKSRHHGLKVQGSKHQKTNLKNNKDKIDQVVLKETYQVHPFLGSLGMDETISFPVQRKVTKKLRTMRPCEQEAMDDIPMDIVELLAKNLHEKRKMNAETKKMWNFTQISDKIKDHCDMNVTKCHNENVKHCSKATFKSKPDCRMKARNSSAIGNRNLITNQNQDKLICSSTRFMFFPQSNNPPTTGPQMPVIDSFRSSLPKDLCWDRKKKQPSGQHHVEQIPDKNSSKIACDRSCMLLKGSTPGTKALIFDAKLYCPKKDSDGRFPESNARIVADKTDCQKYMNTANEDIPCSKVKAKSSNNQGIPATTSSPNTGNSCHSEVMGSVNSYTDEHKSALNLLKLMDWAAWSSQPHHASLTANQSGLFQKSDLYHNDRYGELLGSGTIVRNTEITGHPLALRHFDQDKLQINPCKPLHPFPVIGTLGSSLQKQFTNHSVNFRRTNFGLKERHSGGLASTNIDAAEKAKAPYSVTHTNVPKFQPSISIAENSNWLLSTVKSISHLKCAPVRDDVHHILLRNYGGTAQASGSSFTMETCVVNRNPAEFTMPDDDNEYMRGIEDGTHGSMPISRSLKMLINQDGQKQQKLMKLTT